MATLEELKMRKMELRDEMDEERRVNGHIDEKTGLEYGRLIDRLQAAERKLLKRVVLTIVTLLALVSGGCVENTMRGAGEMIKGTGALVTGIGTDVVRGADGYSNEK